MISRGTTLEQRNAANSYFMGYNNILFMIVPLIFGYIVGIIGYENSFLVLLIPVIISGIYLFKIYGENKMFFPGNKKISASKSL